MHAINHLSTKRFYQLLAVLLVAIALAVSSEAQVTKYHSGSWYNPEQSGHGFSVEILPDDRAVVYWYVYHPNGTPTFLIAIGDISGNSIVAEAYYNTGMRFGDFNPADRVQSLWGSITLTFHSCTSATLQYSSDMEHMGMRYGSGSIPLTRLASVDGLQCSPRAAAGLYQGYFISERLGRVIQGFAAVAPNGEFAAVSFDAMAGVGTWSAGSGNFSGSGRAVSADPNFTFSSGFTISGQYSQDHMLIGDYNVSGGDYGQLEFYAVSQLYRRGISLENIAGNYNARNLVSGFTGSASISSTGSISGSDSYGCRYNGQLTVLDPQFNILQAEVTVSNCGVSNGVYEGYGAQIDRFRFDDGRTIRLVGTNGQYAGVFDLYR